MYTYVYIYVYYTELCLAISALCILQIYLTYMHMCEYICVHLYIYTYIMRSCAWPHLHHVLCKRITYTCVLCKNITYTCTCVNMCLYVCTYICIFCGAVKLCLATSILCIMQTHHIYMHMCEYVRIYVYRYIHVYYAELWSCAWPHLYDVNRLYVHAYM